ncbi:unnamed protein product, partial [Prunus brigantina]
SPANQPLSLRNFSAVSSSTQPPPPTTATHGTGTKLTGRAPPSNPGKFPPSSATPVARICRNRAGFSKTSNGSFSLNSQPNWACKVLRPRTRSRRDPLSVKQCGTTYISQCELCPASA